MSLGQIPTTVQNRCSDVQSYSKCLLSFGVVLRLLVTEVKVVLLNISLLLSGLQDQSLFKKKKKEETFHCRECFATGVIWKEKLAAKEPLASSTCSPECG